MMEERTCKFCFKECFIGLEHLLNATLMANLLSSCTPTYTVILCARSLSLSKITSRKHVVLSISSFSQNPKHFQARNFIPFFCVEATIDFQQQKSVFIYERFIETTTTYILNKQIISCFSLFIAFCFFMEKKHTKKHV